MGGFWVKGVVKSYLLLMPLVAVPSTLLREVVGHENFLTDWGLHHGMASLDAWTGGTLLVRLLSQCSG